MADGLLMSQDDGVLRITIDRPDRLNALTAEMVNAMADAVDGAAAAGARVIVFTGSGRAFSSGADVGPDGSPPGMDTLDAANRLVTSIRACALPVVSAVNGIAAGVGCSIALAADIAIARESAAFMLAFTKIGLMPDGGASILVAASVGRARATRMALLAEKISAIEALDWGLIAFCVSDEGFEAEVARVVGQLAKGAPMAFAATKVGLDAACLEGLQRVLQAERSGQRALLDSEDFAEGMAAFQAKRPAEFRGR